MGGWIRQVTKNGLSKKAKIKNKEDRQMRIIKNTYRNIDYKQLVEIIGEEGGLEC